MSHQNPRPLRLIQAAQDARDEFEANASGCSCHINPPCQHCTHEGNPANQNEDTDCWEDDMYLAEYFITFGFGQHMGELRLSLANHYTSIWAVDELTTREILWGAREDKFSTVYSSEEEAGVDRFSLIYLPLDQLEPQIGSTN